MRGLRRRHGKKPWELVMLSFFLVDGPTGRDGPVFMSTAGVLPCLLPLDHVCTQPSRWLPLGSRPWGEGILRVLGSRGGLSLRPSRPLLENGLFPVFQNRLLSLVHAL